MSQKHKIPYSIADRYFYEVPERIRDDASRLDAAGWHAPDGWSSSDVGLYRRLKPNNVHLPEQGWKIHVSTTPQAAAEAARLLWEFCLENQLPFKLLRSVDAIVQNNSKYWPRYASGKFCAIYPRLDVLEDVVKALDARIAHLPGPYILSDIRYKSGPVFVRYGAFRNLVLVTETGEKVQAIRDLEGKLVPDYRGPVFRAPEFVELPEFLKAFTEASSLLDDQPFTVDAPLHFSNGGGIYKGQLKDGERTVALREARPNAGLDNEHADSTRRLENEARILTALRGIDCVPELCGQFKVWEHDFLATAFIEGRTLLTEIIHRHPFAHPDPPGDKVAQYLEWVRDTFGRIEAAVRAINRRGVEVADLHPSNIMIGPTGKVTIIDFECAYFHNKPRRRALGALGFSNGPGESGGAGGEDRFALPRVLLMMLLPIVPILSLDGSKAAALAKVASTLFPLDRKMTKRLEALRSPASDATVSHGEPPSSPEIDEVSWPQFKASLIEGISSRAVPERSDILFRGDALQFTLGGASFAYGASGIIHAIHAAGGMIPVRFIDWLVDAGARQSGCAGLGFFDGPHGLAFSLDAVGREGAARETIAAVMARPLPPSMGIFAGRAGVALNLLHLSDRWGDASLRGRGLELGAELSKAVLDSSALLNRLPVGLMQGPSGLALLLLRMHEETGAEAYLDAAETSLSKDVSRGESLADGTFHLVSSPKYLIYLDGGSIGLGLVLRRFLKFRENQKFRQVLAQVRHGCSIPFVMQPGLFQGRAGLIGALADFDDDEKRAGHEQARRLSWHALRCEGRLAFPGNGLTKLSDDLASGSAGILLALDALFGGKRLGLPFL